MHEIVVGTDEASFEELIEFKDGERVKVAARDAPVGVWHEWEPIGFRCAGGDPSSTSGVIGLGVLVVRRQTSAPTVLLSPTGRGDSPRAGLTIDRPGTPGS